MQINLQFVYVLSLFVNVGQIARKGRRAAPKNFIEKLK